MRQFPTRDVLDVIWTSDDGQDILKGVLAYALFSNVGKSPPTFPAGAWPAGTQHDTTVLTSADEREDYVVISWTILPRKWPEPESWYVTIERTLAALSDGDAVAAWCGLENTFARPPALFDPDDMADEVWAALIPGLFVCHAELDKPYTPLSKEELVTFRDAAARRFGAKGFRAN
jgi:hypothetical protein